MNTNRKPQLIVSVDTEEEGLWGGRYRVTGNTTENLGGLPRFQSLCERLGVPPTYVIDAPVLDDPQAVERLRGWQDSKVCEVGAHCHPWCNPPLKDIEPREAETFLCNLPVEVQRAKLSWLTDRIADSMGRTPTSYRAGRYGFNESSATILQELGYRVDSSLLPMHDYRDYGGPDFLMASRQCQPYFGDPSGLIEIPVTAGFTRPGYERRRSIWKRLRTQPWKRLRAPGIADRMGIARRVKLSPEGTRLADLRRLVDSLVSEQMTVLVLMLHSTSLMKGFSPYAKDDAGLEQLYERMTEIIRYITSEFAFQGVTLTQAADTLFPTATADEH